MEMENARCGCSRRTRQRRSGTWLVCCRGGNGGGHGAGAMAEQGRRLRGLPKVVRVDVLLVECAAVVHGGDQAVGVEREVEWR